MSAEKLSLSWNEFESTSVQNCRDLLADTEFVDVTLASHDDEQIQAHKVILCSASPFFKRIISRNKHQHPLLFLRNVSMKTLRSLLNFIYLGRTEVEQDDLEEFLGIAKDLEIKGLSNDKNVHNKFRNELSTAAEIDVKMPKNMDVTLPNESEHIMEEFLDEAEMKFQVEEHPQEGTREGDIDIKPFNQKDTNNTFGLSSKVRDETGNFLCNKCDYATSNSADLKKHNYAIHEGLRYPCLLCEYKATQKSSLNRHMKRHTSN